MMTILFPPKYFSEYILYFLRFLLKVCVGWMNNCNDKLKPLFFALKTLWFQSSILKRLKS